MAGGVESVSSLLAANPLALAKRGKAPALRTTLYIFPLLKSQAAQATDKVPVGDQVEKLLRKE
jgi:hypothetical protein